MGDQFHRIGGRDIANLRLKPQESRLNPPGISVLQASSPEDAARQIREAFPDAEELQRAALVIASADAERVRQAGFEIIANRTRRLPSHHRIVHPDGVAGFSDENLWKLAEAFTESEGD